MIKLIVMIIAPICLIDSGFPCNIVRRSIVASYSETPVCSKSPSRRGIGGNPVAFLRLFGGYRIRFGLTSASAAGARSLKYRQSRSATGP